MPRKNDRRCDGIPSVAYFGYYCSSGRRLKNNLPLICNKIMCLMKIMICLKSISLASIGMRHRYSSLAHMAQLRKTTLSMRILLSAFQSPKWFRNFNGGHLGLSFKRNRGAQHIFSPDFQGPQQFFSRFLLGINTRQIDQPANPPITALLNHGPEFHCFTHGISRSLQIFLASSSTISICRGTNVFRFPL